MDGLVWEFGLDGVFGIVGFDDDNNGNMDDVSEFGVEGSDDILDNDDMILFFLDGC